MGLFGKRALSITEQAALKRFLEMDLNQVRARAEEFERAAEEYNAWLERRHSRRGQPLGGDELEGFAPEVQYGDPAERWRELEEELRAQGVWQVAELGDRAALRWARRTNALSTELSRPSKQKLGRMP